jgi:hypothetical protein
MSFVSINWKPDARELRKFGWAMLFGFGLIGLALRAWPWHWPFPRAPRAATVCWVFGAVAGLLGLTATRAALPIYFAWMGVAFVMGNIVSRIVVAGVYFLVITPMGLAMRLMGRDKLQLRRRDVPTYWIVRAPKTGNEDYERQF